MADGQKAILSLHLVVESCKAALDALSDAQNPDENYPTADFTTLRTDFLSLLSLLHAATTKVALSLKPSSPQHKASLTPLKDISNHVAALVHSIRLMRRELGATAIVEYEAVARNVLSAVQNFAQGLLSPAEGSTEEYLIGVGKVHELIDQARKPGSLSFNNRDAVRKKWLQDHESLADGAEEIQEMCKSADPDDLLDEEEFLDDGWEELGLSSKQKLSPVEQDRTEKVHAMIKITILLHKRVLKDVLAPNANERDNATLDQLSTLSNRLLEASDDLISSMYGPQQPSNVISYLDAFCDLVLKDLRTTLLPSQDKTLEDQLDSLSFSNRAVDKSTKWFITCFEQIEKARANISETLEALDDRSS